VRDLAGKAIRRRIRRLGQIPESVGAARTCPVHPIRVANHPVSRGGHDVPCPENAVLGRFWRPVLILIFIFHHSLHMLVVAVNENESEPSAILYKIGLF